MDEMFPIERSSLYAAWQMEQRAIETHKWYLSERAGKDVGWNYAAYNWVMAGHRERWIKEMRAAGLYPAH